MVDVVTDGSEFDVVAAAALDGPLADVVTEEFKFGDALEFGEVAAGVPAGVDVPAALVGAFEDVGTDVLEFDAPVVVGLVDVVVGPFEEVDAGGPTWLVGVDVPFDELEFDVVVDVFALVVDVDGKLFDVDVVLDELPADVDVAESEPVPDGVVEVLGPVFTDGDELVAGPELLSDDGAAVPGPFSAFDVAVELSPFEVFGDPVGLPFDGLPVDGPPETGVPLDGLPEAGLPLDGAPENGAPVEGPASGIVVANPGRAPD